MRRKHYDLIVIGAGSGGLTAAIGGNSLGAKVLLIEKEKSLGGDCTHFGCVPSKTLIKASRIARGFKNYEKYGLKLNKKINVSFDISSILKKVRNTVNYVEKKAESIDMIKKLGIDVLIGSPRFIDKKTIILNAQGYSAKKFVIATGSRARVVSVKGLDKIKYITNKEVFIPKKFKSLVVIGAGPIGCELGLAFANLGVNVILVSNSNKILAKEDSEASSLIEKEFKKTGVEILKNKEFVEIFEKNGMKNIVLKDVKSRKTTTVKSDEILISIGRVPNVENLNLESAGVKYSNRGIVVNRKTQTTNSNIYAIGDVAGGQQFTHFANHQGKIALTNLIFKLPLKYTNLVPRVTYITPEIASVGINEDDIKRRKLDYLILKKKYSDIDRAITDSSTTGFFKIIVNKRGYIKGAVLVGESSGELISEIAVAMKNNLKITAIADTIHPYPTYAYGLRSCADEFRKMTFTKSKKKWIKKIFRLKG